MYHFLNTVQFLTVWEPEWRQVVCSHSGKSVDLHLTCTVTRSWRDDRSAHLTTTVAMMALTTILSHWVLSATHMAPREAQTISGRKSARRMYSSVDMDFRGPGLQMVPKTEDTQAGHLLPQRCRASFLQQHRRQSVHTARAPPPAVSIRNWSMPEIESTWQRKGVTWQAEAASDSLLRLTRV